MRHDEHRTIELWLAVKICLERPRYFAREVEAPVAWEEEVGEEGAGLEEAQPSWGAAVG